MRDDSLRVDDRDILDPGLSAGEGESKSYQTGFVRIL